MRSLVIALLLSTLATSAFAGADFNVSPIGFSAFSIDGIANPSLSLIRGQTYTFAVSASGHPFFIKTARVTGAGSLFPTGVTNQGVQNGTLTFAVPLDAPSLLFYQCGNHSSMGGNLNISDPTGVGPNGHPKSAWLGPAVPNPTHAGAQFEIGLPRAATIEFTVYDARRPAGEDVVQRRHGGGRALGALGRA